MNKLELLQTLANVKLRKVRSKMLKEALENGSVTRGNHTIECEGLICIASYKNTPIAKISINTSIVFCALDAGIYENTVATIRQRKELKEAIKELEGVLLC
jgi:hypothetical protein